MQASGVDGELVYFLIEDHHITESSFYAMIDSLLAAGEVLIITVMTWSHYLMVEIIFHI